MNRNSSISHPNNPKTRIFGGINDVIQYYNIEKIEKGEKKDFCIHDYTDHHENTLVSSIFIVLSSNFPTYFLNLGVFDEENNLKVIHSLDYLKTLSKKEFLTHSIDLIIDYLTDLIGIISPKPLEIGQIDTIVDILDYDCVFCYKDSSDFFPPNVIKPNKSSQSLSICSLVLKRNGKYYPASVENSENILIISSEIMVKLYGSVQSLIYAGFTVVLVCYK